METLSNIEQYQKNQATIFKLATKQKQTEADMKKMEKLHTENDRLSDLDDVREYIEKKAYN